MVSTAAESAQPSTIDSETSHYSLAFRERYRVPTSTWKRGERAESREPRRLMIDDCRST